MPFGPRAWTPPVVAVALMASMAARAAAKDASLSQVLALAGEYVVRFERDLSTIVAGERYTQEVDGAAPAHRDLESDLLLVRATGARGYLQFRDVYAVDGHAVRPRDERVRQLAANPSAVSAAAIVAESARYNIGEIERTINVPVLALTLLAPGNQWRFRFSREAPAKTRPSADDTLPHSPHFVVSTEVWVVAYRETERPTIIRSPQNGRSVPIHGRFWIEPATGRVLMTELVAEDRDVHSTIDVSYQSEPLLDLLVPVEMREMYWPTRGGARVTGTATYENFRRVSGN